jgi:hypothetical protein
MSSYRSLQPRPDHSATGQRNCRYRQYNGHRLLFPLVSSDKIGTLLSKPEMHLDRRPLANFGAF